MSDDRFVDPVMRLVLIIIGTMTIIWAAGLLFTPLGLIAWFMHQFPFSRGTPDVWSPSPLLFYMIRTTGALYAWIGVSFIIAAGDPKAHTPWIKASGIMLILLGLTCGVSGKLYHMPSFIYLGDAVLAMLGGIAVIWAKPAIPRTEGMEGNHEEL